VSVAQRTGTDIRVIRVGNAEVGTSSGTTFWQDLGVDYSYADYVPLASDGQIVPADRIADWSKAGFSVPNVTNVYTTLSTNATYSDVNAALSSCPSNQVVMLSPGNHTWSGIVDFGGVGKGKVLRGTQVNGTNATTVTWQSSRAVRMWNVTDETRLGIDVNVTANIRKGDSNIFVAATPSWCRTGLLLRMDQLNDEVLSTTNTHREAAGIYRARPNAGTNGNRGQGEIVMILSTNSTTITTVLTVLHDYATGRMA
jgi:hypothetical protein